MQKREGTSNVRVSEFANLLNPGEALFVCNWPVAETYRIWDGWIYPDGKWRLTAPLDDPSLFLSFARLGSRGGPSESTIRRWVNKHGLLTREDETRKAWSWESGVHKKQGITANQAPMRLKRFRDEVQRAYQLLTFYTEIREQKIQAIRARVEHPRSPVDEEVASLFHRSVVQGLLNDVLKESVERGIISEDKLEFRRAQTELYYARMALGEQLALALSNVRLRPGVRDELPLLDISQLMSANISDSPYSLQQSWECLDLLSAMYLQFYLLVTTNKPMRRCESPACRMWFVAKPKHKRFCDDSCRSNARNYPKP